MIQAISLTLVEILRSYFRQNQQRQIVINARGTIKPDKIQANPTSTGLLSMRGSGSKKERKTIAAMNPHKIANGINEIEYSQSLKDGNGNFIRTSKK